MTGDGFDRLADLLWEARELEGPERAAYLDEACGDDAALRAEVESLLAHGEESDELLDTPAAPLSPERIAEALDGTTATPIPDVIGRYRILRQIGSGGMGVVYEAEQDHPKRRVALKMIRHGVVAPRLQQRFQRETEILARLQHPSIAQVHDAGTVDLGGGPQPYFTMELIDGAPITTFADGNRLDVRGRVALLVRVCEALDYAHQRGVVHRDLKPDNVLIVDEQTTVETGSGGMIGRPKILDFGVARIDGADAELATLQTSAAQLVGTLTYMSPEQAASSDVDARSDVYSLGVILYRLLSGRHPHDLAGRTLPDAVRVIQDGEPTRLGSIDTSLRGDLDTITARALESDRERRYGSAGEMAADLQRYLDDQPIRATPPSAVYRIRKFARRNRGVVAALATTMLVLVAATVVSTTFAFRANRAARAASLEAYCAALDAVLTGFEENPIAAQQRLHQAPPELRGWEWNHLRVRFDPEIARTSVHTTTDGERREVEDVAWIEDERALYVRSTPGEPTVEWVELVSGTALGNWDAPGPVTSLDLAADGSFLALSVDAPPRIVVARLASRSEPTELASTHVVPIDVPFQTLVANERGSHILGSVGKGAATVWHLESGAKTIEVDGARAIAISPDGETAILADPKRGSPIATASEVFNVSLDVGWALFDRDDPAKVFLGGREGKIRVFDLKSRTTERELPRTLPLDPKPDAGGSTLRGDGRSAVSHAHGIRFVDFEREVLLAEIHAQDMQRNVSWSPNGRTVAASTWDGAAVWSLPGGVLELHGHESFAYVAAFSSDGGMLATGGWDNTVRLWDTASGRCLAVLPVENGSFVRGVAFSADGDRLLARMNRTTVLWDPAVGQASRVIEDDTWPRKKPRGVDLGSFLRGSFFELARPGSKAASHANTENVTSSYDGRYWVTGHWGFYKLLEAGSGDVLLEHELRTPAPMHGNVNKNYVSVAVDRASRRVATGRSDGSILIAELPSGRELLTLAGDGDRVFSVDFHPDGTRLASGGRDGSIRIWNVESGKRLLTLRGHEKYVHSVTFSPDGSQLASASGDFTVRIWDSVLAATRARETAETEQRMRAMQPMVDRLLAELVEATSVAAHLRNEADIDEADRAAALRVLLSRCETVAE